MKLRPTLRAAGLALLAALLGLAMAGSGTLVAAPLTKILAFGDSLSAGLGLPAAQAANDMLRGIDPRIVRANLDAMITKIQASGAKLLLAGMQAPTNWGEKYKRDFDRIYPELARAHGVTLYPFFLEGVAMDPQLNQADGLHPNERGVAVLVGRIAPVVVRLIGGRS